MLNGEKLVRDTLLLVDDDPSNLALLVSILKDRGYRLLTAKSGEQALSLAARNEPALILLDIMMPGIDGFETCARLKADEATAGAAVIFLSSRDEVGDKVRGLELGAVDYVAKPFEPQEIMARVETHLKVRRLEYNLTQKNRELEEANQHMRRDLEAAARIQQSLLPSATLAVDGLDLTWRYRPCQELAGDYLNVLPLDNGQLILYVLDVCGHGVSSSLLAVSVAQALRPGNSSTSILTRDGEATPSPAMVADRLNRMYQMQENGGLYFTLLFGILDMQQGRLRFVSAGNPGPILVDKQGNAQAHDVPAVPIGLFLESEYEDTELELQPGDRLYLHSDGLVEERNPEGEQIGRARVLESLGEFRSQGLDTGVDQLIDKVARWGQGKDLDDDLAIIALEFGSG